MNPLNLSPDQVADPQTARLWVYCLCRHITHESDVLFAKYARMDATFEAARERPDPAPALERRVEDLEEALAAVQEVLLRE